MAYPISDVPRRIVYSGSAGVGPYAFTFEVLAATDLAVYKNATLLTLTTDYTVSINSGTGTGTITLVVAATGADSITIVGDRAIQRSSDFVTGGDLFANTLNDELDSLTIYAQQVDEKADRSLRAPVTDPTTINMILPKKSDRVGKYLSFDSVTGDPEVVNTVVDVSITAANISSINTVSGSIANVNTVGSNLSGTNTIGTVAGSISNVNTVGGNIANVNTVAGNTANINTVATNIADIQTTVANLPAILDADDQAALANTYAGQAAGSAAQALAIYGSTTAQQAAVSNAQAAASLAQGYAASASSVVQQDLSGITAQALHRSPNAVTAMFVYDTSKDSDGGAWTEKCQGTSWYNETLYGNWLGSQSSVINAAYQGATLSAELITNGDFSGGTTTGWSAGSGATLAVVSNQLVVTNPAGGTNRRAFQAITCTIGASYKIDIGYVLSGRIGVGTTTAATEVFQTSLVNGTYSQFFTATATTMYVGLAVNDSTAGTTATFDNISVKEVTAITTASGDYFQLTTDGKFYRLWKNLLTYSEQFDNAAWTKTLSSITSTSIQDPLGTNTAEELTFSGGAAGYSLRQNLSAAASQQYVFSIYVKAGTLSAFSLFFASSSALRANFDISTQTVSSVGASVTATSIQDAGNGWYRCSITGTYAYPGGNGPGVGQVGATNGTVYIWGAQLDYGSTATTYERKVADGSVTEVFRGNKRDFPRLAAIVAEASNVNIYDLTEPGRPMWMRFVASGTTAFATARALLGPNNQSAVFALNGVLTTGATSNTGYQGSLINFPADRVPYLTNGASGSFMGNIARRNEALGFSYVGGFGTIAGTSINAVAMTVLPDAPVDPVTGLKVPTIAVATGAGVSVIQHSGVVRNSSLTNSFVNVGIGSEGIYVQRASSAAYQYLGNPGAAPASFALTTIPAGSNGPDFGGSGGSTYRISRGRLRRIGGSTISNAIVRLLVNNEAISSNGVSATITDTFNTGHQPGDIRRTYLSDIGAGSVTGPELVTNGDFSGGSTGWTNSSTGTGTATFTGGVATIVGSNSSNRGAISQASGFTVGRTYRVTFTATRTSGTIYVMTASVGGTGGITINASGTYDIIHTAPSTSFIAFTDGSGASFTIDNISVTEVVADRSYKASGATINGTLTKSLVASAAQLVAYSGFSAANYLREPYSADLDFGTGEWSVGAWVNLPVSLPASSFPAVGSPASVTAWTNSTWDTFSSTGGSFTASKDVSGGNDYAYSTDTFSITSGKYYLITVNVATNSVGSFATQLASTTNSRSTVVYLSGTGEQRGVVKANNTGSFSVAIFDDTVGALEVTSVSIVEVTSALVADRAYSSGAKLNFGVNPDATLTATAYDGTTTRTVTTTAAYNTATWAKAEACYTTDGTLAIRVNGVEVAATRGNPLLTLNNSNAVLTIGNSYATDAPFPGSIALLKLSATVPTPEQSVWMYEQEKQMFREGAQVCLPDSNNIADLSYDDATDRWVAVSSANESYWSGLVRAAVTPVPAGSYTRVNTTSGVELVARSTTTPGVDVTIPAYGLREELVKRAEAAARLNAQLATFDYVGGFTANTTNGNTAILSVANLTYPTSYIGAVVTGSGIPSDTVVVAVSGTTIYLSKAATATATGVSIAFSDFILPVGYEAKEVSLAGEAQREGATAQFTRRFDGFRETIRFVTPPSSTALIQIQAARSAA